MFSYRKEIEGLRAVAVLPVLFFHAGFSGFSGGYIGVDIFFVISGYLITSIILQEIERGDFSIWQFYERRARRILPALMVVLSATSVLAFIFMPPLLLKEYAQSVVAVATFTSNIFFFLEIDYFANLSEEMPLLHTWSLAVEEQYYLIFPLLMVATLPRGRNTAVATLFIIAGLSYAVSAYMLSVGAVEANFYLIFGRAWELMVGALVAFLPRDKHRCNAVFNEIVLCLAVVGLVYSITQFDEKTPFPSYFALLPVFATALIIAFSDENTIVGRLLANKTMMFVGALSYSIYLWHQPLFAIVRLKTVGEPSHAVFLGLILLSIGLAYLSWHFVEKPFRKKRNFSRLQVFSFSAASLLICIGVGLAGHFSGGFEDRFYGPNYSETMVYSPKRDECHTEGENYLSPHKACRYFGEKVTWAAIGDSHVVEPAFALAEKLKDKGQGLLHMSFSSCTPTVELYSSEPGCTAWLKESLSYLANSPEIKNVLIAFRYSSHLYGDHQGVYPAIPQKSPAITSRPGHTLSDDEIRELIWQDFQTIIDLLVSSGKAVHILYPIPELPVHIAKAVQPFSILNKEPFLNLEASTSEAYYYERNAYILQKLNSLPFSTNLKAIRPFEELCEGGYCPAVKQGKALYFDDDHLSISGAELLFSGFNL